MKWFVLAALLVPGLAMASVSGIDDLNPNISPGLQRQIDEAITTYYQHPSVEKVDTVLTIMNDSDLLRKKTAWTPLVGFLTIVFENNKQHLFHWMGLNEYNTFAQDVFVTALLHAKLKETANVFAQAHQWQKVSLDQLLAYNEKVDLKHLEVDVPGHIDALWGAFFASGDPVYVNEIISVMFDKRPEPLPPPGNLKPEDMMEENKKLAEATLRQYAPLYKPVRQALKVRIAAEKNKKKKAVLKRLLLPLPHEPEPAQ